MNMIIDFKNATIADEQGKQLAFSIFKDIDEYVKQNEINKSEFVKLSQLSYPTIFKYLNIVENKNII